MPSKNPLTTATAKASESQVERISIALTNMLWKQGYRKIDNDNSEPLQDGKR